MNISFYSYKGGVGRTQLCANVAAYLCFFKNRKVLLWDWDFEAPGLHHYFGFEDSKIKKNGTLELLENHMRLMRNRKQVRKTDLETVDKENIVRITKNSKGGGIDLIPAGNYDNEYSVRLADFDWREFLFDFDGVVYIKALKDKIETLGYDYVLIDSRTGISDYAGICNVLLPNINVVLVSPNRQNFLGSKKIIDQILAHKYVKDKHRHNFILPILSRIDTDHADAEKWTQDFLRTFSYLIHNLVEKSNTTVYKDKEIQNMYLTNTYLRYTYSISAGENLFFTQEKSTIGPVSFRGNYANIAIFLENLKTQGSIQLSNLFQGTGLRGIDEDFSLENGETLLEKAKAAQNANKTKEANDFFEEAAHIFKMALLNNSNYFDGWLKLGKAYLGQKRYDKARGAFVNAIDINEKSAETWIQLGRCLLEMEEYREAKRTMKKAIEIASDSNVANVAKYYHGWILLEEGKEHNGLQLLNRLQNELVQNSQLSQISFFKDIEDWETDLNP